MSATIVYDGVGGGGTLFEGKTFWVAQRIPCRNDFIQKIKSNGGKISPLEKNADILIADHARPRDAPYGSTSWRYIELSLKNGRLENLEDHPAGRPLDQEGPVRMVGSGQPIKVSRTKFTAEDDRVLAAWVKKRRAMGGAEKGNVIFQELAHMNPRHTSQSWRDRWLRYVSTGTQLESPEDENEVMIQTPDGNERSSMFVPVSLSPLAQSRDAHERTRRSPSRDERAGSSIAAVTDDHEFNDEDIELLRQQYFDIMNVSPTLTVAAWMAFAEMYPQHSAGAWHHFWAHDFEPKHTKILADRRAAKKAVQARTKQAARDSDGKKVKDTRTSATRSSHATTSAVAAPERLLPNDGRLASGASPRPILNPLPIPGFKNEEVFKSKLKFFVSKTMGDHLSDADFTLDICGRPKRLFHLWQAVNSERFGGFESVEATKNWAPVAASMNLNPILLPSAANELREIYKVLLAGFEFNYRQFLDMKHSATPISSNLNARRQPRSEREESAKALPKPIDISDSDNDSNDDDLDQRAPELHYTRQQNVTPTTSRKRLSTGSPSQGKRQHIEISTLKEIPNTPDREIEEAQTSQKGTTANEDESDDLPDITSLSQRVRNTKLRQNAAIRSTAPSTQPLRSTFKIPPKPTPSNTLSPTLTRKPPPPSSTSSPTQPAPASSQRTSATIISFFEKHTARGMPIALCQQALSATTIDFGLADRVLNALVEGKGIPRFTRGVWTDGDDELVVQGEKGSQWKLIVRKHGLDQCGIRRRMLPDLKGLQDPL